MPTVPMFDSSAASGAWHHVTAPGGYECWAFDVDDATTDTQLSVLFMSGAQQYDPYLRHVSRYRQDPTRTPLPLPADYGGVAVSLYRGGRRVHHSFTPAKLSGNADQLTLDRSVLQLSPESFRLLVDVDGVRVDLTAPRAADSPTRQVLRSMRLSQHHLTHVLPHANFTGTIDGRPFTGVGTHEYAFGTGPISYSLSRLIRGRVILPGERLTAFFYVWRHQVEKPLDAGLLLVLGPMGSLEIDKVTLSQPHVDQIKFGSGELILTSPKVIAADGRGQRIVFDAEVLGKKGTAHADVFYPQPPHPSKAAALLAWLD